MNRGETKIRSSLSRALFLLMLEIVSGWDKDRVCVVFIHRSNSCDSQEQRKVGQRLACQCPALCFSDVGERIRTGQRLCSFCPALFFDQQE